jgi:lysophospholipase L1-like esterase
VFAVTINAQPELSGRAGEVADQGAAPTTRSPRALKLMVVGDSQGATLAQGIQADPGVYGLSAQPGFTVWNRAILACPIVSFPIFVIDGNQTRNKCGGAGFWQQQWANDVKTFRPDATVVMAGAWDVYDAVMPDGSVEHAGQNTFDRTYERDVGQMIDTLKSTGGAVVLIKPPCYGVNHLAGVADQVAERMDKNRLRAIDTAWQRAAAAHGATVLDLDHVLCPGGVSNDAVRIDGAHFNGPGADKVAPIVARAVREAVAAQTQGKSA